GKPVANARVHGPADEDDSSWDDGFITMLRASGIPVPPGLEPKEGAVLGATTDAMGRFTVGSLSPGDSRVTASATAYFDGNVVVDGLVAGAEKADLRIVIDPATAWVEGTVVDDAGKPV